MKAIIYYSLSGRTKEELEKRYEGDFYRLKGKIKIPRNYWVQMALLGYASTFNTRNKYDPLDIDLDKYDEIVLGSPVWAFTFNPMLKRFLKDHPFKNKKVTILITHEGGPRKTLKHFDKFIDSSNTIIEKIDIQRGSSYTEVYLKEKRKNKKKKK